MKNYSKQSPRNSNKNSQKLRLQIAVEAARLISEEGIDDFHYARKKAAHRFAINDEHALPDHNEIMLQLDIYQHLYQKTEQKSRLLELRTTALNAMQLLHSFKPGLIGSVLHGYAHEHRSIDILVHCNAAEDIAFFLINQNIPYQLHEWKLFSSKHHIEHIPCYQFLAGKFQIKLIILDEQHRKITPLNPDNGKPMDKASIKKIQQLISKTS